MQTRITLILTFLLLLPASTWATDAPVKRGPKAEEFQRLHREMKALLVELAQLQIKYRTADEEKQNIIRQQWDELIRRGETIEPKFVEAAEQACAEAPNADKQVTEFLVKLLVQKVSQDDFEFADRIGKLLMESKCRDKRVANLAGIAAFNVSDYDTAAKYLGVAATEGRYQSLSKKDERGRIGAFYLQNIDNYEKAWKKESAIRRREADADNLPRVLLKTSKGNIELELFENQAPNAVANFIYLVQKGFYDGLTFHRVMPGFMAQGGCPKGDGTGGPGYSIACECYQPNHRPHFRGSLSMAHAGQDTGGSQFFMTFVPTPQLDGKHTVFGRVIRGMDVLAKLQRRDPEKKNPPKPDKIIEAKVGRRRPHEYRPLRMPE